MRENSPFVSGQSVHDLYGVGAHGLDGAHDLVVALHLTGDVLGDGGELLALGLGDVEHVADLEAHEPPELDGLLGVVPWGLLGIAQPALHDHGHEHLDAVLALLNVAAEIPLPAAV